MKHLQILTVLFIFSIPVFGFAHGLSTELVLMGLGIFFLPFFIGLAVSGKGKRLRFFIISLVAYPLIYLSMVYLANKTSILLPIFFPWLLIVVSVLLRMKKI